MLLFTRLGQNHIFYFFTMAMAVLSIQRGPWPNAPKYATGWRHGWRNFLQKSSTGKTYRSNPQVAYSNLYCTKCFILVHNVLKSSAAGGATYSTPLLCSWFQREREDREREEGRERERERERGREREREMGRDDWRGASKIGEGYREGDMWFLDAGRGCGACALVGRE